MYKNGSNCPICGEGKLKKVIKEKTFQYKEMSHSVRNYIVYSCNECEESVVSKKSLKDFEKSIRDFQRSVDGLLTSDDIKRMRRALGFSQEDFARVLGIGIKSFARYENGTVTQSKAMDNLIRIVYELPQSLDVISGDKAIRQKVPVMGFYTPSLSSDYGVEYPTFEELSEIENG